MHMRRTPLTQTPAARVTPAHQQTTHQPNNPPTNIPTSRRGRCRRRCRRRPVAAAAPVAAAVAVPSPPPLPPPTRPVTAPSQKPPQNARPLPAPMLPLMCPTRRHRHSRHCAQLRRFPTRPVRRAHRRRQSDPPGPAMRRAPIATAGARESANWPPGRERSTKAHCPTLLAPMPRPLRHDRPLNQRRPWAADTSQPSLSQPGRQAEHQPD